MHNAVLTTDRYNLRGLDEKRRHGTADPNEQHRRVHSVGADSVTSQLGGPGTILAYSSAIWPDHPCCVMVASQDALQRLDKNALLGLVWAHVMATRYLDDCPNSNQTIQYLMDETGVNRDTAGDSINHTKYIDMPSTEAVREVYGELANASYPLPSTSSFGSLSIEQFFDDFVVNEYADVVHANLALDPKWRPPASNATVRLGLLSGDGHHLAETIALKKGYYENLGLRVVIKQYANGIALVEGFKSREIDVGCCGLPPALLKAINDDVKIRVIEGVNNEGSAVVVRPSTGIKQLAELNGKTVATPKPRNSPKSTFTAACTGIQPNDNRQITGKQQ